MVSAMARSSIIQRCLRRSWNAFGYYDYEQEAKKMKKEESKQFIRWCIAAAVYEKKALCAPRRMTAIAELSVFFAESASIASDVYIC